MSRTVPYLICKYQIMLDGQILNEDGQAAFFKENQGQRNTYFTRGDAPNANALIMEPEEIEVDGYHALSFYIGYQPGYRRKVGYDGGQQKRTFELEQDDHIKSAHIVVIPNLSCMAVEDRNNDYQVPQGVAIKALRSIVEEVSETGEFGVFHLTDAQVSQIVKDWQLIQYDYEVRPLNPIHLSDFNELRSEAMKADRIARDAGKLRPYSGDTMEASGGLITETQQMVDAGYGQSGMRAITPDGDEARVPKPKFHMEKEKNFNERDKPRFLKIMFESDDSGPDRAKIIRTLGGFYSENND